VRLYRTGLGVASLAVAGAAAAAALGGDVRLPATGVGLATAMAVANLHLYDKRIRWFVLQLAVGGPCVIALSAWLPRSDLFGWAGVGLSFAALSALALKEGFCFRVPGVRLVPVALAASLLPLVNGAPLYAAPLLGLAALVLLALTVAKLRMPLGHDIGDRSRYQV
jgi:uncharacterized integral membrane protein